MADRLTSEQRHRCMSHIRSKETGPERVLRRALFREGFRYRLYVKGLPGTPDIVLPGYHTAIFVNGCFWHGHKDCRLASIPGTNTDFWERKIRRNIRRDECNTAMLEALGWNVITVWECELQPKHIGNTVARITAMLKDNAMKWRAAMTDEKSRRAAERFNARVARRRRILKDMQLHEAFRIPSRIRRISHDED